MYANRPSERKINDDLEATQIPLHDVPVGMVVQALAREKAAVRACFSQKYIQRNG